MAVTQTTNSAASAQETLAALGLGAKAKSAQSSTDAMGERFLTLLVSQIRNQDPLNPMDNAQMTSQLAQINTVNGLEKLNATLEKLVSFYDEGRAMQAAAMVGKNVLVAGNKLQLGSEGGTVGGVELAEDADNVRLTIKDGNGLVVRTLELGESEAGSRVFAWDGKTDGGAIAAAGDYSFTVEAVAGTDKITATAMQFGTVFAVVRENSGFRLDLGQLGEVGFDDVKRII